jgi:hypothetical protein
VTVFTVGVRHTIAVSDEEVCACALLSLYGVDVAVFTAGQKQWPVLTAALLQTTHNYLRCPP